jgi:hypothetical protein
MSEEEKQLGNNPKGDVGEKDKDIALPPVKQKVKKGGRTGKGGPPKDTGKPTHG